MSLNLSKIPTKPRVISDYSEGTQDLTGELSYHYNRLWLWGSAVQYSSH